MSTPKVIVEVRADGAAGAESALRKVADAQQSVADATDQAAASAGKLEGAWAKAGDKLSKLDGAMGKLNVLVQGAGAAASGTTEGFAAFASALGAIPGPIGLVGKAVATATTLFGMLADKITGVKDEAVALERGMKQLNGAMDRATMVQKVLTGQELERKTLFDDDQVRRANELINQRNVVELKRAAAIAEVNRLLGEQARRQADAEQGMSRKVYDQQGKEIKDVAHALELARFSADAWRLESDKLTKDMKDLGDEARGVLPPLEGAGNKLKAIATGAREARQSLADFAAALVSVPSLAESLGLGGPGSEVSLLADLFGPSDFERLGALRAELDPIAESLKDIDTFARGMFDSARDMIAETDPLVGILDNMGDKADRVFTGFARGFAESASAAILFGGSLKDAAADALEGLAVRAGAEALAASAQSLIALAMGDPASALGFAAGAAAWAGVAGLAKLGHMALGGSGGGGGATQRAEPADYGEREAARGPREDTEFRINFGAGEGRPASPAQAQAAVLAFMELARVGRVSMNGQRDA